DNLSQEGSLNTFTSGMVLRVLGERPKEKASHLMNAKEQKQEEMVVVRDFPEVFPDDLSGLPPSQEIEFRIEMVPGAIPKKDGSFRMCDVFQKL
nr:putative reverse transcriptase domain-containing protein [Tanacetum cinerariifolium]